MELELIGQPQSFDMYAVDGKRATINISDHDEDLGNNESMFFVKDDLLKSYLENNELTLIWAMWGVREYSSNLRLITFHSDNSSQHYAEFSTIEHYSE